VRCILARKALVVSGLGVHSDCSGEAGTCSPCSILPPREAPQVPSPVSSMKSAGPGATGHGPGQAVRFRFCEPHQPQGALVSVL